MEMMPLEIERHARLETIVAEEEETKTGDNRQDSRHLRKEHHGNSRTLLERGQE